MRKIITILALGMIAAMCHAQFTPPTPVALYVNNGSGFVPNTNAAAFGFIATPSAVAAYCQSSPTAKWSPCTSTGGGGGSTPCTITANGVQYNNSGAFGCDSTFIFDPTTKVLSAGGYAANAGYQGYLALTQNATAAPASPANTFRLLAPQSGLTSSYDIIVPQVAPVAANSSLLCPIGGGQCTWGSSSSGNATQLQGTAVSATTPTSGQYLSLVGSSWTPTTFSGVSTSAANTFTAAQTISTSGNPGLVVTSSSTGAAGFDVINTSSGGKGFRFASSGSANGNGPGLFFITDLTDAGTPLVGLIRPLTSAWPGSNVNVQSSAAFSAFVSQGTTFGASGCSVSSLTGGATAGSFVSGTTGTCTVTIGMGNSASAPHGYACYFNDLTTPADVLHQTATTTTTVTFSGTTVTGDAINFACMGY